MIRICTSLSRAGYEVELVGRELPNSLPLDGRIFRQKRLQLFFKKGKLFYLEYNLRLFAYLISQNFDVICSVDLDSLLPGSLAARLRGKVCVYDAHEYFTEVPEVTNRPMVKRVWEWVAVACVPRLKFAYTVCGSLAEIFIEKYGTPFEVIRNVPFLKPFPDISKNESNTFRLLYQGVLNEGRGLEEMLVAMSDLSGVELWLAGEGDLSSDLRRMATEMGLYDRVKFLGKLPPGELAKLTPQADLGLNLLKNKGLNYYYSLANKAFDYIQAGVPSLSMDFPEYRKINDEFHVFSLLKSIESNEIAAAIEHLRSEKKAYCEIRENCKAAARELIWEKEEKKLLEFYRRVLDEEN